MDTHLLDAHVAPAQAPKGRDIEKPPPPRGDVDLQQAIATFMVQRPHLFKIAERILHSAAEAEDVVQETWLRWQRTDRRIVNNPPGVLTTAASRLAINVLQSARIRHETALTPGWENGPDALIDTETTADCTETVELALRVVLEKLTPSERGAYVLRKGFDYPYPQVAHVLGLGAPNARKLAGAGTVEPTSFANRSGRADPAWCPGPYATTTPTTADVRSAGTPPTASAHAALTGGPMAPEPLGRMVRRLRLDADLTLERLSEASGISDRALSDIERGAARGPQHRTVLAIAAALGLTDIDRAAMIRAARDGRRRAPPSAQDRLPLPRDADDFTGRKVELARITAALTDSPDHRPSLIVVTGPPGYGKTSLAVRAAALVRGAFPDQLFLQLAGLTPEPPSPDVVMARIVHALTGQERTSGDVGLLRQLPADRRLLLVLDDAGYESQVRAALSVAGPAAVLVTSRRSLAGLDRAERVFLDRLCSEDAQQLLAAIIPAEQTAGADLAGLARLCDDVPLALRIAGNRLASRPGSTVAGLAARMAVDDRRLDALTAGDLRMAAAIRLSFDRLCPGAQQLFRRLALVDGSTFGAGLAGALIGQQAWHAEDLLDELADLSLVQPAAGDRYTLHDLLRLFARAELAHELPATRGKIRAAADDWLIATAASAARILGPGSRTAISVDPALMAEFRHRELARAWLTDEVENWSAALGRVVRRGDCAAVADLAVAASWLHLSPPSAWCRTGQPPDGARPDGGHVPSPRPATHFEIRSEVRQMADRR